MFPWTATDAMEGGMTAVVQGVGDAGLAVTLHEGNRRYTLMPNCVPHSPMPSCIHIMQDVPESMPATAEVWSEGAPRCDSSAQAIDGRYARIYKMAHGNVSPCSPPVQLIESPSKCAKLCPASKSPARSRISPTRLSKCNFNHTRDKESKVLPTRFRYYESEAIGPRVKTDESPTRERRPKKCDVFPEMNRTALCRNFEARCLQDISKRTQDIPRKFTSQNTASVNMEIQAVVETISKEVATLPRVEPSKRHVAIPVTPISSYTHRFPEAPLDCPTGSAFKSVQTISTNNSTKIRESIQSTSSSIEVPSAVRRWQCNERSRRRSKSQEGLRVRKEGFRKEILQILESIDCHGDEICQAFRDELIKKMKKDKKRIRLDSIGYAKSSPFWLKASCKHCAENCKRVKQIHIFRPETKSIGVSNEDSLESAVKDWVQEIHIKNADIIERHSLDKVVSYLALKLRQLCLNSEEITKSEIMQMTEEVTFDASDIDRNVQLNNLADAMTDARKDINNTKNSTYYPLKKLTQPTEEEVRGFVGEELLVFINKFDLKINSSCIYDIETDVIDILIDSIDELQWGDSDKVKREIALVLRETSKTQMELTHFTCLAESLVNRFKSFMRAFNVHSIERAERPTFIVLQNTVQNTSDQPNDITNISIEPVTQADVEVHIERYTKQLTQVIEAWWTSILGADDNEKGFREVAINDLAGDIVDRHRFLGMDTLKRSADQDEVEYLKFQIFRWINKLVGEEAMQQALDRAPELMEQIQRIPVPILRMPGGLVRSQNVVERPRSLAPTQSNTSKRATPVKPDYYINRLPTLGLEGQRNIFEGSRKCATTGRRMSEPAALSLGPMLNTVNIKERKRNIMSSSPDPAGSSRSPQSRRYSLPANIVNPIEKLNITVPSIPKIDKEFSTFLNDWVSQIPIPENNAQEQDKAKILRRGIYNGMLVAYVQAEVNPTKFRNEFYLQDFFDKVLEKLLSGLSSSPELASKIQLLKAKVIKRATDTIKAIRIANSSTSYRYRLWDAITSSLPQRPIIEDKNKSTAHLLEEFLKLNITEDYLLFRLHLGMNKSKEDAYRNKISISIRKLYDNAKLLPDNDRILADAEEFREKVIKLMGNVQIPPRHGLQDEADQIVLGHEIAQWMQDLPITQSDSYLDQLQRRRLREALAKKIHDIEKQTNLCDNSAMRLMKNELSKFVEKFSPKPEEAGNLSFLIDEFINRLKNRREKVERPIDFPMFVKHIPCSSSFVVRSGPVLIEESLEDDWANLESPGAASPRILGAKPVPVAPPTKEPNNAQWLTLLNAEEREKKDFEAQAQLQQIPPCSQPAIAASQRQYNGIASGVVYEPVITTDLKGLHTSQVAGTSYHPLAPAGRLVGAPATAPSMHSEMRRLVDLEDKRASMINGARSNEPARSGPIDVASFVQSPAQPVIEIPIIPNKSILRTSQVQGSIRETQPKLVGPSALCTRSTPMAKRSVRPRRIVNDQEVMSGGLPSNQSQLQIAAPLVQQEAMFTTRHNLEEIPEQYISRPPRMYPVDLSIQAPVGFSTPHQSLAGRDCALEFANAGNVPGAPKAWRRRTREEEAVRPETARRRLDLEEVEEEEERERDEMQCRCTERVYRCRRRRPMCCDCEEMDYPRYYPMPYPYCFF